MTSDPRRAIEGWHVRDAMTSPIRSCPADTPLARAADLMARERIHCLAVVAAPEGGEDVADVLGVLSDLDLVAAVDGPAGDGTVREFAGAPLESIHADAPLSAAAHQMREARAHHLVVVAVGSGRPVGVLSTLDIARVIADAEAHLEPGEG